MSEQQTPDMMKALAVGLGKMLGEPTPPATPRGSCAFGQHEWKGTNAEGSCICGELTLSRTPPATPQPETCEWPGCDAPALCQSGNFGNRLVCREHFGITNGPLSPPPDVERLTREAFKAGFLAVCRKKSDDTPLDMLTRVWTFDGVAAADLEPEAYAAWRALSPSTPGEPT